MQARVVASCSATAEQSIFKPLEYFEHMLEKQGLKTDVKQMGSVGRRNSFVEAQKAEGWFAQI